MRIYAMVGIAAIGLTAGACGGSDRTATTAANPQTTALDKALRAGPGEDVPAQPPTARGGGPPDPGAASDALDELRSTPRPSNRTFVRPTDASPAQEMNRENTIGSPPPSPRQLPEDLGPPPPSADVEWP